MDNNNHEKIIAMSENKLYTFVVDFRGGTYCTQVFAKNVDDSLSKWIERLKIEKKEIEYLGDKTIEQLKNEIKEEDYKPIPLNGLKHIWFTVYYTKKGRFEINIIQTEH